MSMPISTPCQRGYEEGGHTHSFLDQFIYEQVSIPVLRIDILGQGLNVGTMSASLIGFRFLIPTMRYDVVNKR